MDIHLQALKRQYQTTGSHEDLVRYTAALERVLGGVSSLASPEEDPDYGPEAVVQTATGVELRCESWPDPITYLRVVDGEGEVVYWTIDEVAEDPQSVLGALVGALLQPRT